MPADTDNLERTLVSDLTGLGDRLADERLCHELYRALTNNEWKRQGEDGAIASAASLAWIRQHVVALRAIEPRLADAARALDLGERSGEARPPAAAAPAAARAPTA